MCVKLCVDGMCTREGRVEEFGGREGEKLSVDGMCTREGRVEGVGGERWKEGCMKGEGGQREIPISDVQSK